MKLVKKTIIITGGGNGIGRALVLELLGRGAQVIAVDRNIESLKSTEDIAGENKENLTTKFLDITQQTEVEEFAKEITTQRKIDGIINNAGIIQPFVKTNDLDYDAIDRVIHVNFFGTMYMTKSFLPHLLTLPEAHIVNISSMGGFLPVPGQTVYGASKAAVKLFSEGLYAELLHTGVRVTVVFPGGVGTEIAKNSNVSIQQTSARSGEAPEYKMLSATEAAKIILNGVERNKVRIYAGKDATFMNILYRVFPNFATKYIAKKMKSLLP